jgi:hypothetical protein
MKVVDNVESTHINTAALIVIYYSIHNRDHMGSVLPTIYNDTVLAFWVVVLKAKYSINPVGNTGYSITFKQQF